jgi:hypothetical protein
VEERPHTGFAFRVVSLALKAAVDCKGCHRLLRREHSRLRMNRSTPASQRHLHVTIRNWFTRCEPPL